MTGRKRVLAGRETELLALYHSGMDMKDIASQLGVAASTVGIELDRLGARKQIRREDVLRGFEQMRGHPDFSFVVGMIWAVGSFIGDKFLIRHKDRQIIDCIYSLLRIAHVSEPYLLDGRPCIQIGITHPFIHFLRDAGWTGRKSAGRDMPTCDLDAEAFVRGYVLVHHSLTWSRNRRRKVPYLRLRIYGPVAIMEYIESHLSEWTGVGRKKLQPHTGSEKMVTIEYTMREESKFCADSSASEYPDRKSVV